MAFNPFPPPEKIDPAFGRDSLDDGVWGATEQRKQLSVVTDGFEGVLYTNDCALQPKTASGKAVIRCASILTLQISRP